jgi:flagellar assembly factor FliW
MIDISKKITVAQGLIGMADRTNYCIADLPNKQFNRFKVLQSIDDLNLAFIVCPIDIVGNDEQDIISVNDVYSVCNDIGWDVNDIAVVLITSIHRGLHSNLNIINVSVNARAPIIINTTLKMGVQYILNNDKYSVQHIIA